MSTLNPNLNINASNTTSGLNNINLLQPSGFKVTIDRRYYDNIEFFAQSVLHPTVSLAAVSLPYKRVGTVSVAGDKLEFSELQMNVLLDENMNSYIEIYRWLKRLVEQKQVNPGDMQIQRPFGDTAAITSEADITISVLSSHNQPIRRLRYIDCVPTSLGDVSFEAAIGDVQPLVFPLSFRYSYFEIE